MGYIRFTDKKGQVWDSRGPSYCKTIYEREGMQLSQDGRVTFTGESVPTKYACSETDDEFWPVFEKAYIDTFGDRAVVLRGETKQGVTHTSYKPLPPYKKNKQAFWRAFNEMIKKALG